MFDVLKYDESNVKQKKREEIIKKSMNIFIREGIHAPTMQEIAKECGISLRSLYYYYKNKEELAVDIQIVCMDDYSNSIYTDYNVDKTAHELFTELINRTTDVLLSRNKLVKYITAFDYYFFNDYPNDKYVNFLEKMFHARQFEILVEKAKEDNTVELYGEDPLTVFATSVQSLLGYGQKIIYREKAMLTETRESRGSLKLYSKMMIEALKKR